MDLANCFETHYYLTNSGHQIDAIVRNKCEAELLEILITTAERLNVDVTILKDIPRNGGYREWWRIEATKSEKVLITVALLPFLVQIPNPINTYQSYNEKKQNAKLIEKKIEHFDLLNEGLKIDNELKKKDLDKIVNELNRDSKIIKNKSNFYSHLEKCKYIDKVGFSEIDEEFKPISNEKVVHRKDFHKYIITPENLFPETDDNAIIEITAPNLSAGTVKWRGIYNDIQIKFDMKDKQYLTEVYGQKVSFSKGSKIRCVLQMEREKDEAGEVKIINYSVITVIEKIDGENSYETAQGKSYRKNKAKKNPNIQSKLFD
jgi:hypothetical protein